jgi:hypothetical protein
MADRNRDAPLDCDRVRKVGYRRRRRDKELGWSGMEESHVNRRPLGVVVGSKGSVPLARDWSSRTRASHCLKFEPRTMTNH